MRDIPDILVLGHGYMSISPVLDIIDCVSTINRQDITVQDILLDTVLVRKIRRHGMDLDNGLAIAYDMAHKESVLEPERAETVSVIRQMSIACSE